MTLTQAGLPLAMARSSAGPSAPRAGDELAVAAERLRRPDRSAWAAARSRARGSAHTRAAGSGARRSRWHRCRRRRRRAGRSAPRCRTRPCGSRTCRRPCTAITGACGSAARAAMANGIEAPIEPAAPLMMRRRGGEQACGHCPISPPSQTRMALGCLARIGCRARQARAGAPCRARGDASVAHAGGR